MRVDRQVMKLCNGQEQKYRFPPSSLHKLPLVLDTQPNGDQYVVTLSPLLDKHGSSFAKYIYTMFCFKVGSHT